MRHFFWGMVCALAVLVGCGEQQETPSPAAAEPLAAPSIKGGEPAAAAQPLSVAEISAQVDDGIVLLTAKNPFGDDLGFGSGFVIDSSGLLLTNYHVVSTASSVQAEFQSGERVEVTGYRAWDADADIAILQLEKLPSGADVLDLSESRDFQRGADVVVIGHPQGLRFSTTKGVISAIQRTAELPETFRAYLNAPDEQLWIQTDMSAAGGSSGGPLLDQAGKVIGMVTLTAPRLGMSFAVHISHLADVESRISKEVVDLTSPEANADPYTATLGKVDPAILALVKDYRRSLEELQYLAQNAQTPEQRQEVVDKHPAKTAAGELLQFAQEHAGERQKAFQALLLACQVAREAPDADAVRPTVDQALGLLLEHFSQDDRLGSVAALMSYSDNPQDQKFLRELLEVNSSSYVQAMGRFALASGLANAPETAERNAEVVELLERIERDYKEVKYGGQPIGESVGPLLYARKHLGVGCTAPAIAGTDSEGKQFKLSDYRGKVVLLDFWGEWCPYCVKMYPAARLLVKKFAERPFVMLGVNTDELSRFQAAVREQKVTWRSWHDGPLGGPITATYRIDAVPMTYLLDADGVIRRKFSGLPEDDALETAVESLLDEMEVQQPGGAAP